MKDCQAINQRLLFAKPWRQALEPLLSQRGINHNELLRDLPPYNDSITTSDYRLSPRQFQHLLAQVEWHVNDEQIWHLLAETFFQTAMSPFVELCLQAPSLQRALELGFRYRSLAIPNTILLPQQQADALILDVVPMSGRANKLTQCARSGSIKLTVALVIVLAKLWGCDFKHWRLYLPNDIQPLPLWQKWIAAIETREMTRIVIPRATQKTSRTPSCKEFNQALYFCQAQRRVLNPPAQLEVLFRHLLRQINRGETLSLTELAEVLGISVSSCKRILSAFGQSYQVFYDMARLYKLLNLLEVSDETNTELAAQLGFSNPNNFRRACKRWLGIAPSQLRQRLGSA